MSILQKPHYIFAFISLITGIILVFLAPPISMIDENQHVRRVTDIADFKFLYPYNDTNDQLAIWAENGLLMQEQKLKLSPRWDIKNLVDEVQNFPPELPKIRQVMMDKNPYAASNPLLYLPFALVFNVSKNITDKAWVDFYILRLTGLFLSVFLIAIAISRMREHKILLSAFCLLPAMMNSRSGVNIDGIVIAIVFLFIGQILYLMKKEKPVSSKDIVLLIILAFIAAQGKGAYVPLLFLAFLIPKRLFSSKYSYIITIILTIIPALIVSFGWSALAKNAILSDIKYYNDNGLVWPDGQFEWIISHPFSFSVVVLKTFFASPMLPNSLWESIGSIGWGSNHISIPIISYILLIITIFMAMAYEPVGKQLENSKIKKFFITLMALSCIGLALTMLYVQWSEYKADVIQGFQGRYLYPLLPLLCIFIKPVTGSESKTKAIIALWVFGIISSASILWSSWNYYYS
ncbi:MAG: DUF2142 domain-containing protein [Rickettsiales bacterium]